ncbi:MAG: class I SAM-dependent methyltransferase [Bacteroidetes bacterium]|nr:class I SAM-dependent methyltransferase [Bacteroidota bacterium]
MNPLFNRIKKNLKQLKPYLKKHDLSCYRIFDWDMPEYPLCIDVYEDMVHVAEYKTKHPLDEQSYQTWIETCRLTIQEVFTLNDDKIFIKHRERQKGNKQYEKFSEEKQMHIVHENNLKFLVNMSDYLDTGLFLDHRITRKKFKEESKDKHVLNLFAYTGAFSVYAAAGGAMKITTVDLSNTYLQWAQDNFKLNDFSISNHEFLKADVKEWIKTGKDEQYDLVILDPPTVSKSKMSRSNFDIQSDHPELIHHVLRQMKKGGILYFSNNFREFQFNTKRIQAASITDISEETIPEDFRNKKIHACWKIIK